MKAASLDDKNIATFADEITAKDSDDTYLYLTTASKIVNTQIDDKYVIDGLKPGYYLIKDSDRVLEGKDDTYTDYILQVTADQTIKPKMGTITPGKTVDDENDSMGVNGSGLTTSDYDIGDDVPFTLTATLPENYVNYSAYTLTFHDNLSEGLTFNKDSVKVYLDDSEITTGYEVEKTDDQNFKVIFENVKDIEAAKAGSVIKVEYTAKLNDEATVGMPGNTNTMYITYSNNPNDTTDTGKSTDYVVTVFTYQLVVSKVEKNPEYDADVEGSEEFIALEGANFKLEKLIPSESGTDQYNGVAGTWTDAWADDTTKSFSAIKNYDDPTKATEFTFIGLDDGIYRLTETVTPEGYNTIEPIIFAVSSTHEESTTGAIYELTVDKSGFSTVNDEGKITTSVENKTGTQLPSTGGVGTTLFYVVGSAFVVVAGVLLVTKKRMSVEEK